MTRDLPEHVSWMRDRHGKIRWRFRRKGFKSVYLHGSPGSAQFMAEYEAALAGKPIEIGESRTLPGTVNAAIVAFYKSLAFTKNKAITQQSDRRILEAFRARHGGKRLHMMERRHIYDVLAEKQDTPARQRHLLRLIRMLLAFAIEQGWRTDNPALGITLPAYKTQGFHSWSEDELRQYEQHHPVGTKARLALALLLYTAARRNDVVQLGPRDIRDGRLSFTYSKNDSGVDFKVPAPLAEVIAATTMIGTKTFLVTDQGEPFKAAVFGNKFKEWCCEAGLPHCSPHGLRKACLRRMAEAGCSEDFIAAVSGHKNMDEIRTYVRAARKALMADEAIAKTLARFPGQGKK